MTRPVDRGTGSATPSIAAVFDMFGPYHLARLDALGRVARTLGIEVAARSGVYDWRRVEAEIAFRRCTLFDVDDSSAIAMPTLKRALARAARRL